MVEPCREDDAPTWWSSYLRAVERSAISPTARSVLEEDCRRIVVGGILASDDGDGPQLVDGLGSGLVMGSIQSGKTASMLGVAAMSLDEGTDVLVVLAGTRIALWSQTYERLLDQLDGSGDGRRDASAPARVLVPRPSSVASHRASPALSRLYSVNGAQAERAFRDRMPIVIVAMKHVDHLRALGTVLKRTVYPAAEKVGRPCRLLVLDDEADDGSILDAEAESGLDLATSTLKQVPRHIVDLWTDRRRPHELCSQGLRATYVAYTATPQANFLQSAHNPLAPRDFVAALRTPYDRGSPQDPEPTFRDPLGLASYYTGGETFYRRVPALCGEPTVADDDDGLAEALRAFLVAGAIRRWRGEPGALQNRLRDEVYATRAEAKHAAAAPHTMLVHPSAAITDHFAVAARILAWAAGTPEEDALRSVRGGERALPAEALRARIDAERGAWQQWLVRYRSSAEAVRSSFDLPQARPVPDLDDWDDVERLLIEDVIPSTALAVINSDEAADDRPEFAPIELGPGQWRAARDLSTIFIAGNVMGRGLTLEGLSTTLFLRAADEPAADTQMQMQRWFGYRGSYLELCRVFVPGRQLELFRAYHESDEAVRRDVLARMAGDPGRLPSPTVLQGQDFLATGKIANVRNVPLCPGPSPFIAMVNTEADDDPNLALVRRCFVERPSSEVDVGGRARGRALDEPMTLRDAAELLDGLRYERYEPPRDGWQVDRWASLEAHIGLERAHTLSPLYRPPHAAGTPTRERSDCPYAIGAYLRLWNACLDRRARGLVATDDPATPWSMVDLQRKQRQSPLVNVGIRYGSRDAILLNDSEGGTFAVPQVMRGMGRDGSLTSTWGSRNPGEGPGAYAGDQWFDYYADRASWPSPPTPSVPWRPPGSPAMILFHLVERPGKSDPGVAVGVCLPLGGPDQFAAQPGWAAAAGLAS